MKLLTKAIEKKLPAMYSQEHTTDPIVHVKFFDPTGSHTWFAYEYDGEDQFFGKVFTSACPEGELGYFSLSELKTCKRGMRGLQALPIERDMWFKSMPLSKCNPSWA